MHPSHAAIAADCRAVVYDAVDAAKALWMQGAEFTVTNFVRDIELGERFHDCAVASFRLSPQDYHRYQSPVSGTIKRHRSVPGN